MRYSTCAIKDLWTTGSTFVRRSSMQLLRVALWPCSAWSNTMLRRIHSAWLSSLPCSVGAFSKRKDSYKSASASTKRTSVFASWVPWASFRSRCSFTGSNTWTKRGTERSWSTTKTHSRTKMPRSLQEAKAAPSASSAWRKWLQWFLSLATTCSLARAAWPN